MTIKVDSTAKCYASDEIEINAPVSRVFNLISDISNWPEWQSSVKSSNIEGDPEPGKSFSWKADGMNINSRLHTVNPDTEIGWTGRIWWISAVHNWYLEKLDDNKTRLMVKESLKGFGSSMMKESLKKGMRKSLEDLKSAAEQ